jgi:hypothetical protein
MLPLTRQEAETFHNPKLPENLFVADAVVSRVFGKSAHTYYNGYGKEMV